MWTQQQMGMKRVLEPGHRHCYLGRSCVDMWCAYMDSWVVNTGSLNNFQNDLEVAVLHKHAWPLAAEEDLEQFVHCCLVEMLECYLVLMLTSGVSHSVHHNRFQYLRRSELGNLQVSSFHTEGKKTILWHKMVSLTCMQEGFLTTASIQQTRQ